MASDDKKTKTTPKAEAVAPKKEAAPAKDKVADAAKADSAKADSTKPEAAKSESSEPAAAAPKSYSRGEGQKPVSQAYKDNWNAIFGKKSKKKKR
jgi:hypothetical protein